MSAYESALAWNQHDIAVADGYEDDPEVLVWYCGEYLPRWAAEASEAEALAMERDLLDYEDGFITVEVVA